MKKQTQQARLDRTKTYAVMRWLDTDAYRARLANGNDAAIAKEAAAKFGFKVAPSSIAKMRNILGVKLVRIQRTAKKQLGKTATRLASLDAQIRDLTNRLASLESSLGVGQTTQTQP